jgi:predicted nucleic-acid-binding Zn-ribbon protein
MTEVSVAGRRFECLVCGGKAFTYREIKLNTSGMSLMNLDWANKSGTGVICDACGFVHTFADPLEWHKEDGTTLRR